MNHNLNVLMLCENCISCLKEAINSCITKEAAITLSQKLFLLETAMDTLKSETNHPKETNTSANFFPEVCLSDTYLSKADNSLKKAVEEFEKDIIRSAISENGSKRKAATALKVDHSTLIKKCQRYKI